MRIPLDHICVRSGVLCPRCQGLVDSRVVEPYEVDVMRVLLDLEDKPEFKFLKDAVYHKTLKLADLLVITIQLPDSLTNQRLINKLDKQLSEVLGIKVRVIDKSVNNIRSIAFQLVTPARISGINTLWLPDGSVQYIVRIPKSDSRYLPASKEVIEEVLSTLVGSSVRIRTE
ncbi:MAG: transcription elongation factor [Desulfurococcaceae archaeon]|nr:transcription elongation factor [Desulfurococcaceae archaeon]